MSRKRWLNKRRKFIGGSDVGTILGLNDRYSKLQLFYQKLGRDKTKSDHNIYTATGTLMEDTVLTMGNYVDLDSQEWVSNWANDKPQRENVKFPYMINNPDLPFFLANVDGLINYYGDKADGIAEAKTISRQSADKWEGFFPPYYISQVHVYMMVLSPILSEQFSIINVLQEGLHFTAYPVFEDKNYRDMIIDKSFEFSELVAKGRDIIKNGSSEAQIERGLVEIEPEPDATPAYDEFLSKRFKNKKKYIVKQADQGVIDCAREYVNINKSLRELTKQKQLLTNKIKKEMDVHSANQLDMQGAGKITYNKRFYVNFKKGKTVLPDRVGNKS
jgi:predicted phage-related endonuclease